MRDENRDPNDAELPPDTWIPDALGSLAGSLRGAVQAIESVATVVRAGGGVRRALEELDGLLEELAQIVRGTRRAVARLLGKEPPP